jgi:hypothetical protein
MRYVIQTNDEQGLIGIQLAKWEKEQKLQIIEKSETLIEIQEKLGKVASALSILKKVGYNSEIMKIYLRHKTNVGKQELDNILYNQEQFLRQIGAIK